MWWPFKKKKKREPEIETDDILNNEIIFDIDGLRIKDVLMGKLPCILQLLDDYGTLNVFKNTDKIISLPLFIQSGAPFYENKLSMIGIKDIVLYDVIRDYVTTFEHLILTKYDANIYSPGGTIKVKVIPLLNFKRYWDVYYKNYLIFEDCDDNRDSIKLLSELGEFYDHVIVESLDCLFRLSEKYSSLFFRFKN